MTNNELYHHGILGMKWGVRRYQNKDGSLTPEGKRRYEQDIQDNLSKKKEKRIDTSSPNPKRWTKEDTERKKNLVDKTSHLVEQLQNVELQTRPRLDLSNMTDKEMRDRINRELLEQQYNKIFASETQPSISKGRQYMTNTLHIAGDALAVTSSALSIALAIKELKS